jgi:membrane-associated phospholipid phosphatase
VLVSALPPAERRLALAWWALWASASVVVALGVGVRVEGEFAFDEPIARFLDAVAPLPSNDVHIDPVLTSASIALAATAFVVVIRLLLIRAVRAATFVVLASAATTVASNVTKGIVQRPPIEGDTTAYSFPSGSSAWTLATVAALVLVVASRRARLLSTAVGAMFVVAYAATITYEDWHYASDVFAGWALGTSAVAASWLVLRPRARTAATTDLAGLSRRTRPRRCRRWGPADVVGPHDPR